MAKYCSVFCADQNYDGYSNCVCVCQKGMVLETSTKRVISAIKDMKKLEDFSDKKVAKEKAIRMADEGRKKF